MVDSPLSLQFRVEEFDPLQNTTRKGSDMAVFRGVAGWQQVR